MLQVYVDLENAINLGENLEGFEHNCVWTSCATFWQLWQEYMWAPINVLKSGSKISDSSKRHHTTLNLFDINGTLA